MKKQVKTEQPKSLSFEKPAKQRILEAADRLFRLHGIRVGVGPIAYQAYSNADTVAKYFGNCDRLTAIFVKSLIDDSETTWEKTKAQYPHDPEGCLRDWIYSESDDDLFRAATLLSRSAAELQRYPKDPLLSEIERCWQCERRWVVRMCNAAGFREPDELADKLLLLVLGSRNVRQAYGYDGPNLRLSQAADDLMVAHGAIRKPPFDSDDCDQ